MIPGIGAAAAELLEREGELLGKLAADRFLTLNEYTAQTCKVHTGRFRCKAVSKLGKATSNDPIQKAWQSKPRPIEALPVALDLEDVCQIGVRST